jgi:hypothetical protein
MTHDEFRAKYGIQATFEDMNKATGFLKYTGDLLTTEMKKTTEQMRYTAGLNYMFTQFMETQLMLRDRGKIKNANSIKLEDFAKDFESVMSEQSTDKSREPYEGLEFEALDSLRENANNYCGRDLETCLAEKIKNGASLGDFYKQTDADETKLDENQIQESRKAVGTMFRVMDTIIHERTWRDRINPLNWPGMIAQNLYRRHLANQIKDFLKKEDSSLSRSDYPQKKKVRQYAMVTNHGNDDSLRRDKVTELDDYKKQRENEIHAAAEAENRAPMKFFKVNYRPDLNDLEKDKAALEQLREAIAKREIFPENTKYNSAIRELIYRNPIRANTAEKMADRKDEWEKYCASQDEEFKMDHPDYERPEEIPEIPASREETNEISLSEQLKQDTSMEMSAEKTDKIHEAPTVPSPNKSLN